MLISFLAWRTWASDAGWGIAPACLSCSGMSRINAFHAPATPVYCHLGGLSTDACPRRNGDRKRALAAWWRSLRAGGLHGCILAAKTSGEGTIYHIHTRGTRRTGAAFPPPPRSPGRPPASPPSVAASASLSSCDQLWPASL